MGIRIHISCLKGANLDLEGLEGGEVAFSADILSEGVIVLFMRLLKGTRICGF